MYREIYLKLIESLKDDDFFLQFIEDGVKKLVKYVDAIESMELRIPILRFRLETEEFQQAVMTLDADRRMKHNVAIDTCNQLNRLCAANGIEKLFTCDMDDRYAVAEAIAVMVTEFLEAGLIKREEEEEEEVER